MSEPTLVELLKRAVERAPGWGLLPDVSPEEQLVIAFERAAIDVSRDIGNVERVGDYGELRRAVVVRLWRDSKDG